MANDQTIQDEDFAGLSASQADRHASVGEFESVGTVTGTKAVKGIFNKANRKRLWAYAFVFFLVIGAIVVGMSTLPKKKPEHSTEPSGVVRSGRLNPTNNTQTSEQMRQEANRYNEETLPEVQKENPTAHPVMTEEAEEVDLNPYVKQSSLSKAKKMTEVGDTQTESHSNTTRNAGGVELQQTDKLIEMLIQNESEAKKPILYKVQWDYTPSNSVKQSAPKQGRNAVAYEQGTDSDVANTNTSRKCKPIVRAGSQYLATSDLALNSDVGGPVSVTLRNGKLRDIQMIGKFERKEEFLRIELDKLVLPEETVSINAIALDINTTLNAVSGEVDSHLLYRYGWWGFGTVLKAIGSAAEKNSDNNIIITDGTVIQNTKKDSAREIKMMLGSLGTDTGAAFQDSLNRPITVTLNVDDEVGVFFLEDVCRKTATDI